MNKSRRVFTALIVSAFTINLMACDSHSKAPVGSTNNVASSTQENLNKENEVIPVSLMCSNSLLNEMGIHTTDITIDVTDFEISYCTVSTDYGSLSNDISSNQKSLQVNVNKKTTVTYSLFEGNSLPAFDYNQIKFEFYKQDRTLVYETSISVIKMDDGTYSVGEEFYSGSSNSYGKKDKTATPLVFNVLSTIS